MANSVGERSGVPHQLKSNVRIGIAADHLAVGDHRERIDGGDRSRRDSFSLW